MPPGSSGPGSSGGPGRIAASPCRARPADRHAPKAAHREWRGSALRRSIATRSFRKLTQNVAMLLHDPPCKLHLPLEIRIIRGDSEAIRRFGQIDRVALLDAQLAQRLLREQKPSRVTNLGDLERQHGDLRMV